MSATRPLVCVCVPSYNSEKTIAQTLESILSQTYSRLKVILVDNASTDGTVAIAERFAAKDGRLKIFRSAENIGGERNYSRCIQLAGGDYTAIYHADDAYGERMVEEQVAFLEAHREAGAVFTAAWEIDGSGKVVGRRSLPGDLAALRTTVYSFEDILRAVLKTGNFLIFPSAMVRTSIYKEEIRAWNQERYKTTADLDVWLRIAERHGVGILPEPLMYYRLSESSYSYNYARLRTERRDLFLVLDDYTTRYSGTVVGERESDDYRLLKLKDDVNIAINHVIKGSGREARTRLEGIFSITHMRHSCRSFDQLKILLIGYAAWILSVLPIGPRARALLSKIRHRG
jgi:glycosyltransferase involved in cell wall biosynthesis